MLGHEDWEKSGERTYLSPGHLGQSTDELWGDIAVALQHLFVNHFANCKPQRRLEPLWQDNVSIVYRLCRWAWSTYFADILFGVACHVSRRRRMDGGVATRAGLDVDIVHEARLTA